MALRAGLTFLSACVRHFTPKPFQVSLDTIAIWFRHLTAGGYRRRGRRLAQNDDSSNYLTPSILTYLVFVTTIASGQNFVSECNCSGNIMTGTSEGQYPDTTITFSTGQKIILCGSREIFNEKHHFSEFVLQVCGNDSIIDFWGAVQTCRLIKVEDTLKVVEVKKLPTGPDRSFVLTDWHIENIFFMNGILKRSSTLNWQIHKYSQNEIKQTLKEFERAPLKFHPDRMELAYKLFISAISGDKTASIYFTDFATRFGVLDGGDLEEYKDLQAMLSLWKSNSNR
jgi:hypothetical protein